MSFTIEEEDFLNGLDNPLPYVNSIIGEIVIDGDENITNFILQLNQIKQNVLRSRLYNTRQKVHLEYVIEELQDYLNDENKKQNLRNSWDDVNDRTVELILQTINLPLQEINEMLNHVWYYTRYLDAIAEIREIVATGEFVLSTSELDNLNYYENKILEKIDEEQRLAAAQTPQILSREQQQAVQRQALALASEYANQADFVISEYESCIICTDPLDNQNGPGPSKNCNENCNDVVIVCDNNHMFHRGCILDACNQQDIDVQAQMGLEIYGSYYKEQERKNLCPLCMLPLNPTCIDLITIPKVFKTNLPIIKPLSTSNLSSKKRKADDISDNATGKGYQKIKLKNKKK